MLYRNPPQRPLGAFFVYLLLAARACLKNAFRQMYVTVCGRLNHLTDDLPNEGGVAGKGIKGNALCRLNSVQISRKVVNTTLWRRYIDGGNDFSNTL